MGVIRRWLCSIRGHEFVRQVEPGCIKAACIHCMYVSSGWDLPSTCPCALSSQDIEQTCQDLLDVELSLHGGG